MSRFLTCLKQPKLIRHEDFKGAGMLFTDGNLILAGYQPHKSKPSVSGIGGRKKKGEIYWETALRETLEELLELETFPKSLYTEIQTTIYPKKFKLRNGYANFHYSFDDLITILELLSKHQLKSPLYESFPTTLTDLLFQRKHNDVKTAEISQLCLLPVVHHNLRTPFVDNYFVMDMHSIGK